MVVTDDHRRRKDWARDTQRKLRGRHREKCSPPQPTGTQSYSVDPQPAEESDLANRRGTAQPSVVETAQERRNNHVERWIVPWAYSVCLRAKSIRDSRRFGDHVDLLTARAECNPAMEDEHERLELLADEMFEVPETPNAFTVARQRLQDMNAREATTGNHSDAYVAAELRLFKLTGAWGLDLSGNDLFALVNEVEGDLQAYHDALRKAVPKG